MVVLECPDWVNIIALTPEREVVFVEQYRQGSETVELKFLADAAPARPIRSPPPGANYGGTGYTGENARLIGACYANPAIMNNRVHTILVENCQRTHEVEDAGEDLITDSFPKPTSRTSSEKAIRHSIIVAVLQYFALTK